MSGPNAWMMVAGAGFVLIGFLLRRWAARHDLKDAAIESAWTLVRARRTAANPTAIETKLADIGAQPTWTGKATRTAGTAVAHVMAQAARLAALILILAGLALAAAGFLWR